ncbi:MAG: hypothetical protein P8Y48_14670, partial [Novosphingobium sp.]
MAAGGVVSSSVPGGVTEAVEAAHPVPQDPPETGNGRRTAEGLEQYVRGGVVAFDQGCAGQFFYREAGADMQRGCGAVRQQIGFGPVQDAAEVDGPGVASGEHHGGKRQLEGTAVGEPIVLAPSEAAAAGRIVYEDAETPAGLAFDGAQGIGRGLPCRRCEKPPRCAAEGRAPDGCVQACDQQLASVLH